MKTITMIIGSVVLSAITAGLVYLLYKKRNQLKATVKDLQTSTDVKDLLNKLIRPEEFESGKIEE